ncbi:pyridoxal phosphate-dependent decarboxylase family protein [Pseudoprimorskyibacter insulae]|uniref:L-2,4-diaminobutyrate decarboxylase n=1 Tax=Pseudoprimorskyibacter insulae TaxID=1695997 RepID=A0A2R8B001_9RHOB|nr:pyridoxal-dependent decarboxylase [Pseudoprimorskyibacter insulae]SPF81600.1 L-2,4-diaminobutyrate decarboxylase [Pseudoprimorskyibacter insulae]
MDWSEFEDWGKKIAEWAAEYHQSLRDRPVRPDVAPGTTFAALPACPPETGEAMTDIMTDFHQIVMPGITHWQHPRFFAYFPANAAPPSMLAEFLVTVIAPQCMLWQTSPSATEMEERICDWMRQSIGLPDGFTGAIQDSASSATLAAVLVMRERALNWQGKERGLFGAAPLRIYSSAEVHTSIDRAVWFSGIGQDNLVRIPTTGPTRGMDPAALEAAIVSDKAAGLVPAGIIGCTGGTSNGACDDLNALADIAERHDLYLHIDAAWAGSAMICPEFRTLWAGAERADSIVFNPHKWLGAQFDCSIQFLRNPDSLIKTLAIRPEFLLTHNRDGVTNFSEWSIPLGRRFRALKLWFLLRSYGLEGLRTRLRNHVRWSHALCERLRAESDFEITSEPILSLFTFRYTGATDADAANQRLVDAINEDGRIYLTQTLFEGQKVIRFQAGQFDCTEEDINMAFEVITQIARDMP